MYGCVRMHSRKAWVCRVITTEWVVGIAMIMTTINQQEDQCDSRETQLPKCCGVPWSGYLVRWQRTEGHSWDEEAKSLMTGLPTGHSLYLFLLLGAHQPRWYSSRKFPTQACFYFFLLRGNWSWSYLSR